MEKEATTYETPISSLRRLIEQDQSDNFEIIIKIKNQEKKEDDKQFKIVTSTNKARVISKNINDIYQIDPTVNNYEINYQNSLSQDENRILKITEKIIESTEKQISIDEEEKNDFYRLLIQLGEKTTKNEEEIGKTISSIDEAISLLSTEFHNSSIIYLSERMKDFLSKNWSEKINTEIVNEIIDTFFDKKKEDDENNYEELFETMIQKDEEVSVIMHFLTKLKFEEMNEKMIEYIYEHLDDDIMNNEFSQIVFIIRQHYITILKQETNKNKNKIINIESTNEYNGNELKGLIDYLESKYGENLETNNIMKISGGGSKSVTYPLTNLIKYDSNQINLHYYNYANLTDANESEGWIEFDFCERKVNLSSYTIRTNSDHENWNHPKTWRIVGSNDKDHWVTLDHQTNNSVLRGKCLQHRFQCENKNKNYYRYIKYIQEDNWNSDTKQKYDIYLTCIEFFGSISSPNKI